MSNFLVWKNYHTPQNTWGVTISDDIGDYLSPQPQPHQQSFRPFKPSPTLSEKMKDPDYAAAYNRQQERRKEKEYSEAMGKSGRAYTPVGLYAQDDDDMISDENNDAPVLQWNRGIIALDSSYHQPVNYTGDVPPQLKKQLDEGQISQSEYEEKNEDCIEANPQFVTTTYPMHYAMRSPKKEYGEIDLVPHSEKYTGQPGLYIVFRDGQKRILICQTITGM